MFGLLCGSLCACAAAPRPGNASNPPEPTQAAVLPSPTAAATVATSSDEEPFSVSSGGIASGVLDDAFGARGQQKSNGIPSRSLPLTMANAPDGTACFALGMIDPDGGNWVHWLAVNISSPELPENASIDLAAALVQGKNDFGFVGYGGPTPPSGTHTYVVTAYALSAPVALENGFTWKQFRSAVEPLVLASAELTGDYTK